MAQLNPKAFLSEAKSELSKVVWPTRDETIRLTAIVIIVSVLIGIFIGGLDLVLAKITQLLVRG